MLVKTFRNYAYEDKHNDMDRNLSVREQGDKTLLDSIEIAVASEQEFTIKRGDNVITNFTKEDYENENVDLTLKMLKSKVLAIFTTEEYLKVRGTRKDKSGKEINCYFDNLIKSTVEIVIE